jgi:hypothetical protein
MTDDNNPKPYRYALAALVVLCLTSAALMYDCNRAPPDGPSAAQVTACAEACAKGLRSMRARTPTSCECAASPEVLGATPTVQLQDSGAP